MTLVLYDPKRVAEQTWARDWQRLIHLRAPTIRVRMNYPYRGTSDGLTTALRQYFTPEDYMGLEIETNNALMKHDASRLALTTLLTDALSQLLIDQYAP